MDVPSGLEHIKMLAKVAEHNRRISAPKLGSVRSDLAVFGISLSILYQAGTCHRRCFGGPHILESLSGRAYNLACSAYILICRGFYDEALSLVRSMGEIANLLALSFVDKNAWKKWIQSDTQTRLREFGPGQVRKLLTKHQPSLICADQDWYSKFCESYTHVHPGTKPNMHNNTEQGYVGGMVQDVGITNSIGELTTIAAHVAMLVSKYAELDDVFDELVDEINRGDRSI